MTVGWIFPFDKEFFNKKSPLYGKTCKEHDED